MYANENFKITLTPNTDGYGSVTLDWSNYDYRNKNFKVYKSANGGITYETVGIDYTTVSEVRVLQVYPDVGAGQLQSWLVDTGYGHGVIRVGQVSISEFNSNPSNYLYETSSGWSYDVVFFGTWDRNNYRDLSAASYNIVNKFAKAGKGIIFGHDVALNNGRDDIREYSWGGTKHSQNYFDALANSYIPILYYSSGQETHGGQVKIVKKGLFTTYPNYIGEIGTTLNIPNCHSWGQRVRSGYESNIWLNYTSSSLWGGGNFYLISYNNCAMIQTGHSNGAATSDEQKILSNLVFYMNQLLFNSYHTRDASAQDVASPNKPVISNSGANIIWTATDNGSTYSYYVESYDKNDTTITGLIDKSNTESITVTTGVKSYRYILDNNEVTNVTLSNGVSTTSTSLPISRYYDYIHIAAVDGAGNISATSHFKIPKSVFITYDKNNTQYNKYNDECTSNATGDISIQEIPAGTTANIKYNKTVESDQAYTKVGYTFIDWNTKSDGTGDTFKENDLVSYENLLAKYGFEFTLYAQWEPITYQIRFNSNDDSKGDWNEADSYFQTVTNNGSTVDTIRYDQWINLVPNKFTRKSPILLSNNVEINKDYEFIGWGNAKLQSTASYTDKQKIRNFRNVTEAGKIYDVYALWKRPIALTFNMNGGRYNGESREKELRGCVYNSRYSYEFNITNGKTAQQTGLQSIQSNTIDAYGAYDSNGINMKYTKVLDGVEYRFLGWSLTPTATEPDISLCPYNSNRKSTYTIYKDTTLYAVWEPVLSINFTLQRTLGNLKFTDGASPISTIHSISAVTPNPQVSTIIKPGEQGQYIIETKNEDLAVKVAFDTKITDIYTHEGTWQDSLNPSTSEDLVTGQAHGLDREYTTRSSYESRKFYIPQYLGTEQSYVTSKGVNVYNMMCTISQPSYYYDKVYGKEEDIEIIGTIYISPNKTYSNTEIPSVLDELRSKLKIVLK